MRIFIVSVVVLLVAFGAYYDPIAVEGPFIYDDAGTIKKNPLMPGNVSFSKLLTHDYWGTALNSTSSHKSFRPLTSATFKVNYIYAELHDPVNISTFWFHMVNYGLHAIVSALSVVAASYILPTKKKFESDNLFFVTTVGILFALHPVHTEAVSNLTGRAEVLMSLFYLLGFIDYARKISVGTNEISNIRLFLVPTICMVLSHLSKENGVMLLCTCIAWEFATLDSTLQDVFLKWKSPRNRERFIPFLQHVFTALLLTFLIAMASYFYRGIDIKPDFIYDQNPAGFHENFLVRFFSKNLVHLLYIKTMLLPFDLCCDWSGKSIDLIIDPLNDVRIIYVAIYMLGFAFLNAEALFFMNEKNRRKGVLVGLIGFMIIPFFLSANILVVVGTMKADRLAYLPSLGLIIFVAIILDELSKIRNIKKTIYGLLALICLYYIYKLRERNLDWSNAERLWSSAYAMNKKSSHTGYNYGLELGIANKKTEAVKVLEHSLGIDPSDPQTMFVYAMMLRNLWRCDEVNAVVDRGLRLVAEKERVLKELDPLEIEKMKQFKTGVLHERDSLDRLRRDKSNFIGLKALCVDDIPLRGKMLYEAIEIDPSNEYVVKRGLEFMSGLQQLQNNGQLHQRKVP